MQHRFTGTGPLAGHSLGNLLIAALWEQTGDAVTGLDWVAALLEANNQRAPMTLRTRERAVTATDYELLARAASPRRCRTKTNRFSRWRTRAQPNGIAPTPPGSSRPSS